MSNIGVYSNLYTRLCDYAELLDRVLIKLKRGDSKPNDEDRRKLGQILIALAQSPQNFSTQLLVVLLSHGESKNMVQWEKLGKGLLSETVTSDVILKLEKLANTLESERADTFAKMRGGHAR